MWNLGQFFVKQNIGYLNGKKTFLFGLVWFTLFSFISFIPHPYHVSYTEINYKAASNNLNFAVEVFTDDLENEIKLQYHPEKFFLGNDTLSDSAQTLIEKYVLDNIHIIIDGIVLKQVQFLPVETNPDRTTIYFELNDLPHFKSFAFYNEMLTRTFLDQQNIVEFKYGQKKEKALFTKEKTSATWIIK
tara:strand:- start:7330 stop:7893 length:564 start_codon:yes stop_codon:yes gene_type:complete